jgi:hypothetical protein
MSKLINDDRFREIKYRCTSDGCGNEQTIRYFLDEVLIPFTCCVKCRSGFGKEPSQMASYRVGMFPVGEVQPVGARA